MKNRILDIICGLLILLFVYAAASKLFDYTLFKMQLRNSPLIASYAGTIAWLLPIAEVIIVVTLTVMHTRLFGLYASLFLLLLFTFYIAGMLLSGVNLPCSCGGIIRELSWGQHLLFNLFFIALSIAGIVLLNRKKHQATKNAKREFKKQYTKIFRANKEVSWKPFDRVSNHYSLFGWLKIKPAGYGNIINNLKTF